MITTQTSSSFRSTTAAENRTGERTSERTDERTLIGGGTEPVLIRTLDHYRHVELRITRYGYRGRPKGHRERFEATAVVASDPLAHHDGEHLATGRASYPELAERRAVLGATEILRERALSVAIAEGRAA